MVIARVSNKNLSQQSFGCLSEIHLNSGAKLKRSARRCQDLSASGSRSQGMDWESAPLTEAFSVQRFLSKRAFDRRRNASHCGEFMKTLKLETTAPFQGLAELVAYDEGLFEKEGLQ